MIWIPIALTMIQIIPWLFLSPAFQRVREGNAFTGICPFTGVPAGPVQSPVHGPTRGCTPWACPWSCWGAPWSCPKTCPWSCLGGGTQPEQGIPPCQDRGIALPPARIGVPPMVLDDGDRHSDGYVTPIVC